MSLARTGDAITGLAVRERLKDEWLYTWIYPSLSNEVRELVDNMSDTAPKAAFAVGRTGDTFVYVLNAARHAEPSAAEDDDADQARPEPGFDTSVVATSKMYAPEAFEELCRLLLAKADDGVNLTSAFLALFVREKLGKKFAFAKFTAETCLEQQPLAEIISVLGLETILVYSALLLKRRVVVLSDDLPTVASFVRCYSLLVPRRRSTPVWPYLPMASLPALGESTTFIAGVVGNEAQVSEDLYDILVDVSSGGVIVAGHARDDFKLAKIHKEIATALSDAAESGEAATTIVENLSSRTSDLVDGLSKLADDSGKVSIETIKERKMSAAMKRFLVNLATAEGMLA